MDIWIGGWMSGWRDRYIDGWMDGWMRGEIKKRKSEVRKSKVVCIWCKAIILPAMLIQN